ncbi:MAG: hypothetical protein GSR73_05395 [Desulfurococcales archaeon]|nr:hypothetical protein [Desulfurococcales archaeon]
MGSKLLSLREAVELVEDGDSITISGITFSRNPMAFVTALIEAGRRDLYFIDREPGLALDILVAAGALRGIRAAMATLESYGLAPNVRRAVEEGSVEFLEDTCGAVIAGLRAGSYGLPFMPVAGVLGSQLVELHERAGTWRVLRDPFNGGEIVAVKAITPDVAVIHAHYCDEYGNCVIEGPRYEDELKIRASRRVIMTAEEIVDSDRLRGLPFTLSSMSLHVDAVVHVPRGAWPTAMYGLYRADWSAIEEYVRFAREGRAMEWVEARLKPRLPGWGW